MRTLSATLGEAAVYEFKGFSSNPHCPFTRFIVSATNLPQNTLGFNIITFPSTQCSGTGICNKFDVFSNNWGFLQVQISQETTLGTPILKDVEITIQVTEKPNSSPPTLSMPANFDMFTNETKTI
jgi:hypothetical protein